MFFFFFSPLASLVSKVLAHFTAQADLIPINPVIVDVAGGGRCCQSFWFQLSPGMAFWDERIRVHRWSGVFHGKISKIFTKPWQGALWGIMINLQTKRNCSKLQKQRA